MSCLVLLQGIFPTQRLNSHLLGLLHWQAAFFTTVPLGNPQDWTEGNTKRDETQRMLSPPPEIGWSKERGGVIRTW